jgi:hypothetical protein
MSAGKFGDEKVAELKARGLLPSVSPRQLRWNQEMRLRPRHLRTRKSMLEEHFAAHRGSSMRMIARVLQMWEAGELELEHRGPRADSRPRRASEDGGYRPPLRVPPVPFPL